MIMGDAAFGTGAGASRSFRSAAGLFGLYLRLTLEDSPAFEAIKKKVEANGSLGEVVSNHMRQLLLCIGLVMILNVAYYTILSYLPLSSEELKIGTIESTAAARGHDGRHDGRDLPVRRIVRSRWGASRFSSAPASASSVVLSGIRHAADECGMGHRRRVGDSRAAHRFAGRDDAVDAAGDFPDECPLRWLCDRLQHLDALFGGTAPYIIQWLICITGNKSVPAFYLMTAAVIALIPILLIPETAGRPLLGSKAQYAGGSGPRKGPAPAA